MLSIWFPVTACAVILVYLALLTGFTSLTKHKDYSTISIPVAFLVLMTTLLAFKSTAEVFSFGNFSSPVIVLCYQPVMFLLLWVLSLRHPVTERSGQEQRDGTDDEPKNSIEKDAQAKNQRTQNNQRNPTPAMLLRLQHRGWERWSNALIALSFAALLIGLWKSRYYANIGIASGITYGLCTVFMVLTSYMELYTVRKQQ